jgi:D-alanyl-D-alanine carboxypeptidase
MSDLTNVFAEKEVFSWLCANAWKFGFVLRYPEDKVDTTGYSYESWHWRFVGRTHALSMLSSGKCLEEYLSSLPHTAAEDQ